MAQPPKIVIAVATLTKTVPATATAVRTPAMRFEECHAARIERSARISKMLAIASEAGYTTSRQPISRLA
jgi:hypothetical protein